MYTFELVTAVLPSIVSIVAIIVPAVLSIKSKHLDIAEKESAHRRETIYKYYADFCTGFARYSGGIETVKSAALIKESVYKLVGFCPECRVEDLLSFASTFDRECDPKDDYYQLSMFEGCVNLLRKEVLKE